MDKQLHNNTAQKQKQGGQNTHQTFDSVVTQPTPKSTLGAGNNSLSNNKQDFSKNKLGMLDGSASLDQHQVSQFNAQSTEMFSSKHNQNGFNLEENSKDETSLFNQQLYDRSLMENPSQDILIGQIQNSHFISQDDPDMEIGNRIQETLSENLESGAAMSDDQNDINNQNTTWGHDNNPLHNHDPTGQTFFDSTTSSRKDKFNNRNNSQQRINQVNHNSHGNELLIEQSPYQDVKVYTRKKQATLRQAFPMKKTTIDRIIYPVYTKRGIKYGKKRAISQEQRLQQIANQDQTPEKMGKLLDGFLILFSCRVKLPHESIKSKLASQKIVEVIEEDLCYFQNLNSIDLSDNRVRLEQLKNLKALSEVNLQYNMIQSIPPINVEDFPKLESLNLSYNNISPASIRNLFNLKKLKVLDLQGNSMVTLPEDMFEFSVCEELNLSSNSFSSSSTIVNPAVLFKALGQMPRLKRLNLSRNRFQALHYDFLAQKEDFKLLQELDFGFNLVQDEEDLMFCATGMKSLQLLVITGNPIGLNGKQYYQQLEENLVRNLSATLINEDVPDHKSYLKKTKVQKQLVNFPYPNPIKLFSREAQKEIKGEYLNAEMMNQGVALQIAEIRPNTNIEKEIFPRELTQEYQDKEIFTPPNHKQMRFIGSSNGGLSDSKPNSQQNDQFFITEDINQQFGPAVGGPSRIIHEEHSQQESEIDEQANEDMGDDLDGDDLDMEDENFDFGRAKLDYFKSRARDILTNDDQEIKYDSENPLSLNMCYKNLKNQLRNPIVVHNNGSEYKPGYLKMTFSMCRNAVNGDRFLEISKLKDSTLGKSKQLTSSDQQSFMGSKQSYMGNSKLPPLMRAGKDMLQDDENARALLGLSKKKTKKEEQIDKKIEYLLETYKKQDEELMKKAQEKEQHKSKSKKVLRDKFGFSDDEDDNKSNNKGFSMKIQNTSTTIEKVAAKKQSQAIYSAQGV